MHGANYKNSMRQARYIISRTTFERRPYGSKALSFEAQFVCQRAKKCMRILRYTSGADLGFPDWGGGGGGGRAQKFVQGSSRARMGTWNRSLNTAEVQGLLKTWYGKFWHSCHTGYTDCIWSSIPMEISHRRPQKCNLFLFTRLTLKSSIFNVLMLWIKPVKFSPENWSIMYCQCFLYSWPDPNIRNQVLKEFIRKYDFHRSENISGNWIPYLPEFMIGISWTFQECIISVHHLLLNQVMNDANINGDLYHFFNH